MLIPVVCFVSGLAGNFVVVELVTVGSRWQIYIVGKMFWLMVSLFMVFLFVVTIVSLIAFLFPRHFFTKYDNQLVGLFA